MKKLLLVLLSLTTAGLPLHASRSGDTVRGALIGAATGALLGELHSGISTRTAVPVMAGVGALAGYTRHQYRNREYYGYQHTPHYAPSYYTYYPYAVPHTYQHARRRSSPQHYHQQHPQPASTRAAIQAALRQHARTSSQPTRQQDNRHPGVVLIPVTIRLDNGMSLTINVARIGDDFVGPRGEIYPQLPSPDTLRQIYRP